MSFLIPFLLAFYIKIIYYTLNKYVGKNHPSENKQISSYVLVHGNVLTNGAIYNMNIQLSEFLVAYWNVLEITVETEKYIYY